MILFDWHQNHTSLFFSFWLFILFFPKTLSNITSICIVCWILFIQKLVGTNMWKYWEHQAWQTKKTSYRIICIQQVFDGLSCFQVIDLFKLSYIFNTLTILTCYATSIVVIYLNLPASMRLFTSDTNWLVPTEHASGSHAVLFRRSTAI